MDSRRIQRLARAKINLSLSVLGRRDDGYHDLESVFVPLDLADRLELEAAPPGVLDVHCRGATGLDGARNLAHRALAWLREASGPGAPGFRLRIDKRIPVAAGLGGGSSDAAAALLAAQTLLAAPLPAPALLALGAELGADLPFFLAGGRPAWVRGTGERIEPLTDLPDLALVLVWPGIAVSTAEVFGDWDALQAKSLTKPSASGTRPRFFESVARAAAMVHNDLEQVTAERVPEVGRAVADLRAAGALAAAMSGSGSSVFGLFASTELAEAASRELTTGPGRQVRVVVGLGQSDVNGQH